MREEVDIYEAGHGNNERKLIFNIRACTKKFEEESQPYTWVQLYILTPASIPENFLQENGVDKARI